MAERRRTLPWRIALLTLVLSGASPGHSQPPLTPAPAAPVPVTSQPVQGPPATGAPAAPTTPPLTQSLPAEGATDEVTVDADWYGILADRTTLLARGNVTLAAQGFTLKAQEVEGNLETGLFTARGGVSLEGQGERVTAQEMSYNVKTREWSTAAARAATQPQPLVSPLYLSAREVKGESGIITAGPVGFTTCDLEVPHYHFAARRLTFVPGRRLVAERASLYLGKHRVFTWPRLVVPLRRYSERGAHYNLVPQAGQNNVEGLYLKTAYNYALGGDNLGTARLDLMSKRGVGVGLDQAYRLGSGTGNLVIYGLLQKAAGGKELTGSLRHQQRIFGLQATLNSEIRQNSYLFAPGSSTSSHSVSFTRTRPSASSSLTFRLEGNHGSFGSYRRQSLDFGHQQRFGSTSAGLNLGYFDSSTPGLPQSELNTRVRLNSPLRPGNLTLVYDRRDALKTPPGGLKFASLERLPEVTLATGGSRFRTGLFHYLPGTVALGYGSFHEEPTGVSETRAAVEVRPDPRRLRMGSTEVALAGGLRQMLYGNGGAQYILDGTANWVTHVGRANALQLNYTYLKPNGYTPFRFDDPGQYNTLSGGFVHRDDRLRVSLTTGYDLRGGPFRWQDATLRVWGRPSESLLLLAATSFDVNHSRFRDVVNEMRLRAGDFRLDLGTRYQPQASRFATIRWRLQTPFISGWRLETLGGYNGIAKRFDYRVLRITRDHHDWQTSLAYVEERGFRVERGFRLMFHLKAFPIFDDLAVGQYGQALSTDVGEVY